jgi:RNAse (barnase) inhibitor barstar
VTAQTGTTSMVYGNLATAFFRMVQSGVEEIELDGATWTRTDDFYVSYLAAVGAPDWPGRNLDAPWDSLTGGDINRCNPPLRIRVRGITKMSDEAREIAHRFRGLVVEAHRAGHQVQIDLLP